jgi:hypothetical protein
MWSFTLVLLRMLFCGHARLCFIFEHTRKKNAQGARDKDFLSPDSVYWRIWEFWRDQSRGVAHMG